ncbi:MAG: hypothetical protein DGJ47_000819 [Rickettsiaceae bacterium]
MSIELALLNNDLVLAYELLQKGIELPKNAGDLIRQNTAIENAEYSKIVDCDSTLLLALFAHNTHEEKLRKTLEYEVISNNISFDSGEENEIPPLIRHKLSILMSKGSCALLMSLIKLYYENNEYNKLDIQSTMKYFFQQDPTFFIAMITDQFNTDATVYDLLHEINDQDLIDMFQTFASDLSINQE